MDTLEPLGMWKKWFTTGLFAFVLSSCTGCGLFCDRYCDRRDRDYDRRDRYDRDDPCRPPPRNYDNDCR
jgi:hypothetical protein